MSALWELTLDFATSYLGQAAGYFLVIGLLYLLVWRLGRSWLAARRIEGGARRAGVDGAQIRHEVFHSLVVLAVGTAQVLAIRALQEGGWLHLPADLGPWGWPGAIGMGIGLLVFNDLWFYGVHRLLHTRWLFRHVHSVHHRSVDVNPFTSYSFHGVEALLISAWVIPATLLLPLPMGVLGVLQAIGLANNVMSHLGYELLPPWWVRAPGLRWTNSATFHSMHHTGFKGNYGLFTRLWDRWLGTELPGYEATFEAAHARRPAAPPLPPEPVGPQAGHDHLEHG